MISEAFFVCVLGQRDGGCKEKQKIKGKALVHKQVLDQREHNALGCPGNPYDSPDKVQGYCFMDTDV